MKSDNVYLEQIIEAIDKIKSFTQGYDYAKFSSDQKTQSAVIMQLALIGEMAKKVSKDTQSKIELPWKDIAGFRDRAIHDYYRVDLSVVWKTLEEDINILKKAVSRFLSN